MTPCLADTGSNYSTPVVTLILGMIVLLIGVGVALLLVKKGKGAAGGALLVLFLVGAGTLGTTGASPARAASPSTSCTTSTPTPVTTPTATSTPIVTPTPPPPTCAPDVISSTVEGWGYSQLRVSADVTDTALLTALGSASITGANATVLVTDTDSGDTVFSGDVTFSYDPESATLSIPRDQLSKLAGDGSRWPFDQPTTLALAFTLTGANDCPITVSVTGEISLPE
jgi:hypothetical protein